ncbi:molybdopterin-containing oxidoreductase family protein [Niveispirillum fermenti]|uniref:molybdopterin-containing oxidoreductase family protein n=1 Tax=Niveispirillum fermenti TaxID=1233113 RepID=UPI003A854F94
MVTEKRSFCRLCGSFCAFIATVEDNRITAIRPDADDPVSRGYMCLKGMALGRLHHHPNRLDQPYMRVDGRLSEVKWDAALDDIAGKLRSIIDRHGPQAIGAYAGTPAVPCASLNVWRGFMASLGSPQIYSTVSVDVACGPLVAERVTGSPMMIAQPDSDTRMAVLIGINPMVSHGHNYFMPAPKLQLKQWADQGELWVVDPRRTETAELATHHLAPWPGSEFALLGHAVREILRDGADRDFIETGVAGIDALRDAVDRFTLDEAARLTRLPAEALTGFVAAIRRAGRIGVVCGTGISMGAHANATWFLGWALMGVTGSLDRPGGSYFNPGFARNYAEQGWTPMDTTGPGPASRPDLPSRLGEYPCAALADEIEAGNLKALFIIAGNPVLALPDTGRLLAAFAKLDLLVVVEMMETATTAEATHLLPGTGQLEMSDITLWDFLNPLEYARYAERVVEPVAGRRPLWWMLREIGRRIGVDSGVPDTVVHDDDVIRPMLPHARAGFDVIRQSPAAVVGGRTHGWVAPHLPGGRWNLGPADLLAQVATADMDGADMVLTPQRQRARVNGLMNDGLANPRRPERPELHINPGDAAAMGIAEGEMVRVETDRGHVDVPARIERRYRPGVVSLPHGFDQANVNHLTDARDTDPLSGMPTLGAFPVRVRKRPADNP